MKTETQALTDKKCKSTQVYAYVLLCARSSVSKHANVFVGGWASVTNAWVTPFKCIMSCPRNRPEYYKDPYTFSVNEILIKVLLYIRIGWSSHRNWERTFSDLHSTQQRLSKGIMSSPSQLYQHVTRLPGPLTFLDFKNVLCFKEQMKWKAASIHPPAPTTMSPSNLS